jgi:arylsulfatase A-like enzyme
MTQESGAASSDDRVRAAAIWPSPLSLLLMAGWFGLVAGLLELLLLVVRTQVLEKGFFLRSTHFVWMVPVSDLAIFGVWGLMLALASRLGWRLPPRWVLGSFLFLACASQLLLVRGVHSLTCAVLSAGVAYRAALWIEPRLTGFERLIRRGAVVLLVILGVLAVLAIARDRSLRRSSSDSRAVHAGQGPNVLLIVLDTVRADHLSLYGYGRDTTPYLVRLSKEGVRFDRARSAAPWTLPSHSTLFTGRWPHEHLAERLGRLDATYPTLAEFLAARGYATAGFVANQFFCGHESGLSRGFQTYRDYPINPGQIVRASSLGWLLARTASRIREELLWMLTAEGPAGISLDFPRKTAATVNGELLDWLDETGERPFFAFLNYFDAHDPYLPPGRPAAPFGASPKSRGEFRMLRDWQKLNKTSLGPSSLALARDGYDDCIASLDRELGALMDELGRRNILERTVVILTADHGEQFGEHGAFGHGMSLYESEVHVPLIVIFPGRVPRGRVVREAVSLRDVPATVVDLTGLEHESPFPGRPLSRAWDGSSAEDPRASNAPLSELDTPIESPPELVGAGPPPGPSHAILVGSRTYIRHEAAPEELYDLDADPGESRDLSRSASTEPILAQCRRTLARILAATGTPSQLTRLGQLPHRAPVHPDP